MQNITEDIEAATLVIHVMQHVMVVLFLFVLSCMVGTVATYSVLISALN